MLVLSDAMPYKIYRNKEELKFFFFQMNVIREKGLQIVYHKGWFSFWSICMLCWNGIIFQGVCCF